MRHKRFVGVTGSSGSGKSTAARELAAHYRSQSIACEVISLDDFYRDGLDPATTNWDDPSAFDHERFAQFLHDLETQETAEYPNYDFRTSRRTTDTNRTQANTKLFIFEGIFAHHPAISHLYHAKIFVHTDLALCFERRKVRDMAERGQSETQVISAWNDYVLPMYETHILPKLEQAHIVITNNDKREDLNFDMAPIIEDLNPLLRQEKTVSFSQMRHTLLPQVRRPTAKETVTATALHTLGA